MYSFISGAIMTGCFAAGLFFYRFWRETGDRLFQHFAVAFWILALERTAAVVFPVPTSAEPRTSIYIIRLIAFILIFYAILSKNWSRSRPRSKP